MTININWSTSDPMCSGHGLPRRCCIPSILSDIANWGPVGKRKTDYLCNEKHCLSKKKCIGCKFSVTASGRQEKGMSIEVLRKCFPKIQVCFKWPGEVNAMARRFKPYCHQGQTSRENPLAWLDRQSLKGLTGIAAILTWLLKPHRNLESSQQSG